MRISSFRNLLVLFFLFLSISIYAQDLVEKSSGEYFTIYAQEGVDLLGVAYKIKLGSNFYLYQDSSSQIFRGGSPREVLAENIDSLFKEVSDILDMHLYSYHGDIKIFLTQKNLENEFFELFGEELKTKAFYCRESNAIYLAADSIKVGILTQEVADAIVSHYFVVKPPDKVKNVLFEHVKYSIENKLNKE